MEHDTNLESPYKNACRSCLAESQGSHLMFEESSILNSVGKMFTSCTRISISPDDDLPKTLCVKCYNDLTVSFSFFERSLRSDVLLRDLGRDRVSVVQIKNEVKIEFDADVKDDDSMSDENDPLCHTSEPERVSKSDIPCMDENAPGPNQCGVCGLRVQSLSALVVHMRKHTGEKPYTCDNCSRRYSHKSTLKMHLARLRVHGKCKKSKKEYMCESCGRSFASSSNLKMHTRTHTGETPHECSFCHKRFMQPGTLIAHRRTHTGEKPYECRLCDRAFVDASHLKRHQSVHSADKPFVCNACGKGVKSAYALKQHCKTHTDEKEHVCDQCGASFLIKGNLVTHIRKIHSERSGQCGVCQKVCSDLDGHMAKHTGERQYRCGTCDRTFAGKRGLVVHSLHHARENKYRCTHEGCDRSFSLSWALECHLMKHTGRAPFTCKFCSKTFLRLCHLTKHMKINHPNEN